MAVIAWLPAEAMMDAAERMMEVSAAVTGIAESTFIRNGHLENKSTSETPALEQEIWK